MSCETAGIDGSNFISKRKLVVNQREQDRSRQITSACVEAALTEMDYRDDFPDTLKRSLQDDYEQQTKK